MGKKGGKQGRSRTKGEKREMRGRMKRKGKRKERLKAPRVVTPSSGGESRRDRHFLTGVSVFWSGRT